MNPGSIIVTGAAGFIGSNVVKMLNRIGRTDVIIVDRLSDDGRWKNLVDLKFAAFYDKEDFLVCLKEESLGKIETIIHLGACATTTEKDERYLMQNNAVYSKKIFDYCVKNNVRLIYASSAATYGDGLRGYSDIERNLKPLNCYGYSKFLFDEWVLDAKETPPQCVGLKFFNVYGAGEYHKGFMASTIFHSFHQAQKDGVIKLFKSYKPDYKDGEQKRDFVYIADVVDVIRFFLEERPSASGIYNVGTGEARTFNDIASAVFRALGKESNIQYIDMPEGLKDKYQYFTEADMSSLRTGVGYAKEFTSLEKGIEDYIKEHLLKNI